MKDHHLDQCIIISGESGFGKTEASKLVMQFVAAVSGKEEEVELVKQQLLQSNPVLEGSDVITKASNLTLCLFAYYLVYFCSIWKCKNQQK